MTRRRRSILFLGLLGGIVVGSLYLVFELGRYQGGYSIIDQRRDRAEMAA